MSNFYKVTDNVDQLFASDVNQYADVFSGNADAGIILLGINPLAPPGAPTVAVNAVTGNLTGSYQYVVAFLTGYWHGEPGTGTLLVQGNTGYGTASASVSPSGQQVSITNIPTGPTGTVARVLGRTKANAPGTFYALTQINDNTTTSWTDNTPDSGLGAVMTNVNTTGTFLCLGNLSALPSYVPPVPALCIVNGQWYIALGGQWVQMVPPINPASSGSMGIVELPPSAGSPSTPVVPYRAARVQDQQITTTSQTTVLSYTPAASGNFSAKIYLRVVTAATNVSITINYTDTAGAETYTVVNQSMNPGEYIFPAAFFNAVANQPITINVTAGTANQCYVSASLMGE